MSNAITELSKLNFDGIEWITELKNKLCANSNLSQEDIELSFSKILSRNTIRDITIEEEISDETDTQKTLYKLYDNTNVAGLSDNNIMQFSPILTIIYGKNGSGKTSYYKILKDAFHSKQEIIGNIYTDSSNAISAKIDFVDKEKHIKYQRRGDLSDLTSNVRTINWNSGHFTNSKIKFCDQEILNSSLSKKDTGWSVDRFKLGYYDTFREALNNVEELVDNKISELTRTYNEKYNFIYSNLKSEESDSYKASLDESKDDGNKFTEILKTLCDLKKPYNYDDIIEKNEKDKNLSVKELNERNDLLKAKRLLLQQLEDFCVRKAQIYSKLVNTSQLIKRLKELKESVDFSKLEQYHLLFDPKINGDKYLELIKKIAETAVSFDLENYPENVDKCFYCNQPLPEENINLIKEIHKLIDKELNKEIDEINTEIRNFLDTIKSLSETSIPSYQFTEIGDIYMLSDKSKVDIVSLLKKVYDIKEINDIALRINELNIELVYDESHIEEIKLINTLIYTETLIVDSNIQQVSKQIDDIETIRKKAIVNISKLNDIKFCVEQKTVIEEIINLLSSFWKYKDAKNQFQGLKTKVSRDKGRVEDELIRRDYISKFNEHLSYFELANRDKISRPFSNPDGKSKIAARIETESKNFELDTILSEGEAKVYSLCDWFSELEFDDNEILIFDDPITSLDQPNIQKTVEKIISLCNNYQVIVFTHNFEFYHRLIQKSLGGSPLQKGKCEICDGLTESNQCIGLIRSTGKVHKCGTYYQIEHILNPGFLNEEVMFLSLDWQPRLDILRSNLLSGDIREADKHLRTTINNFFERYILNDIKRKVYKNNDLIKEWRDIRPVEESDYNDLMDIHNKVSGEGTIHESSPEVRTTLDARDYINLFNKTVRAINNIRNNNNPSPPNPIDEITI
jgi:energy-coupling factor transporter ATP-binding protein EcfA2